MNNIISFRKEPSIPDFATFEAAVRTRMPQSRTLPAEAIAGVERIGRLVHVLRIRHGLTLRKLETRTGLAWLWLALLEQGVLLPSELTEEDLEKLGQAFPTRANAPNPGALFRGLAEQLQRLRLPTTDEEESEELTVLLAASEGHGIAAGENPPEQLALVPIGTFEVEGIRYEALADAEGNVFLQPSPVAGKTHLVLDDVSYVLRRAGGDEGRCQVIGLGRGQLELFFAWRSIEEDQHRIGFKA